MKKRKTVHIFLSLQFMLLSFGPLLGIHAHSHEDTSYTVIHSHSHDKESTSGHHVHLHNSPSPILENVTIIKDFLQRPGHHEIVESRLLHIPEPLFEHVVSDIVPLKIKIKNSLDKKAMHGFLCITDLLSIKKDVTINRFIIKQNEPCQLLLTTNIPLRAPPINS